MKKIFLFAAAGLMMLSSCDLDINEDPNYPSSGEITSDLEFPAVINAIADATGDQMFNYGGFFAQYFEQMPEANQYNDLAELNIDESKDLFNRCYRVIYAGALQDIEDIKTKTDNTANLFACQVMRTLAFQLLVDNTSETPYTEALQSSISAPKYDDGKTVYEGVLAELDEAEAALDADDIITMTDPLLQKDLSQWRGFANALRLRMYLRLIDGNVDAASYTSKAQALVSAGNFFSDDVAWDVYSDQEGQFNPWYHGVFQLTNNHCAAYPIVSYMLSTNDPRISYAIKPRTSDGSYVGQFPGAKQSNAVYSSSYKNQDVSAIDYAPTHALPIYLFTQSELQFLIAEVQLRFNHNEAAAKAAYEEGVAADFASRGTPNASEFLANSASWDGQSSAEEKLKLIYMQKWTALFMRDHMEAWSEIRRTDVPSLSPHSGADINKNVAIYTPGDLINPTTNQLGNGNIAMSIPYSSDSRKFNINTPSTARKISDKVFWDVK